MPEKIIKKIIGKTKKRKFRDTLEPSINQPDLDDEWEDNYMLYLGGKD